MTGRLTDDTAITRVAEGEYTAELSPAWEIWGPAGGYLASVALRAAGAATGRARPASITAHFLGVGGSGPIELHVETNRETKVATSVTVRLTQAGRPWLDAVVWGVDDDLAGLEHLTARRPTDLPDPDGLASVAERAGGDAGPPHPFWRNLDIRPLTWVEDWERRTATEPEIISWYRFVGDAAPSDPWVDACRSLILIDLDGWPAAGRAHVGDLEVYAPTIEVTARFVGDTTGEPWLLGHAEAPGASGGLIAATNRIWTRDRRLAAVGGSTLLCRPATRRPDR